MTTGTESTPPAAGRPGTSTEAGPGPTGHPATDDLLARFTEALRPPFLPLVALWIHGSIAEGTDYRPGRSDLDLVAVVERPCTPGEERRLVALHEQLIRDEPLAGGLHCSYLPRTGLEDPARDHPVWAHREYFARPLTPVARRELHTFGRVLYGRPPGGLLPPVTDRGLADHILGELRGTLSDLPALRSELLLQDGWLDFALLTVARMHITLRDGRLITKREALDVLRTELGAPAELVADIQRRRYGGVSADAPENSADTAPDADTDLARRRRRAALAAEFLDPVVARLLS
ncbi:nucleotidyltransferase domain-containing protein [Streptomyces sp. NPDC000594]|uniref:nucleotidyltransferase domain-containing protein n=1 Tax=Streptomyces sp. NPDC000594 TaxID=3154261 RepID=UPI003318A709